MKTPKEDPADRAARLTERRMSELEQVRAAQGNAAALTSDMRSIYGIGAKPGIRPVAVPSIFGMRPK